MHQQTHVVQRVLLLKGQSCYAIEFKQLMRQALRLSIHRAEKTRTQFNKLPWVCEGTSHGPFPDFHGPVKVRTVFKSTVHSRPHVVHCLLLLTIQGSYNIRAGKNLVICTDYPPSETIRQIGRRLEEKYSFPHTHTYLSKTQSHHKSHFIWK